MSTTCLLSVKPNREGGLSPVKITSDSHAKKPKPNDPTNLNQKNSFPLTESKSDPKENREKKKTKR